MSASAWAQCRIIGWFTGSGATVGLPDPPVGWPIERVELLAELGVWLSVTWHPHSVLPEPGGHVAHAA